MALINDDMAEKVFGIFGGQEICISIIGIDPQGLIRGNMNARVPDIIYSIGLATDLCRVRAKDILEGRDFLSAQLVTVTDEQGALQQASIRNLLEEIVASPYLSALILEQ